MTTDPRFSYHVEDRDGQKALCFLAEKDQSTTEDATTLVTLGFEEIADLAGLGQADRAALFDPRERLVYSNGWQSWCFAGELAVGEAIPRPRLVPQLALYCDGPGPIEARGELLSHFLTYVRCGEDMLVLVSRGTPERATPPVAFRWDRATMELKIGVAARGARFGRGELVAEIRLFHRKGYFEAKDALREAFRAYGHFDRLAFLGTGSKLIPGGYESWYNHYTRINEAIISADLAAIDSNDNLINAYYLRRGKPTVFQIDDGWERAVGDWAPSDAKFPRGMKAFAEEIEAKGMIPGLWIAPLLATKGSAIFRERPDWLLRNAKGALMPAGINPGWDGVFYCLDISLPEVKEYLSGIFETIIEDWGYRYLKLDFLYAGFVDGAYAEAGAAYQHYDALMRRLTSKTRNSRGGSVAYLGCGAPLEPSFRHFPLMRIGADTKEVWEDALLKHVVRHQGRPSAYANLTHTIGRALLDGTVFLNDPDVVFCRTRRMRLNETEKEMIALVDALLASQIMFSDDPREFGDLGEVAFTKRIVELFDMLPDGEYGARRVSCDRRDKDVYSIFGRDVHMQGIVNLSDRPWSAKGGSQRFEPHSISLFDDGPRRRPWSAGSM